MQGGGASQLAGDAPFLPVCVRGWVTPATAALQKLLLRLLVLVLGL